MATECKKKRTKKDPKLAEIRTAANKRRNVATAKRRQEAKLKKTYRWALRQNIRANGLMSATTCREIRASIRRG